MKHSLLLSALFIAGCATVGSNGISPAPSQPTAQQLSGSMTFLIPAKRVASSARGPAFVGQGTTHAYVFINRQSKPSNSTSTCTGTQTAGTGTFCTISWSTTLPVPASYLFQVETDDGSTVLAEGAATYVLNVGTNVLAPLTLNGVAYNGAWATTSCTVGVAGTTAGACTGTLTVGDKDNDPITYNGATPVPTAGNNPTTGTVFDNGGAVIVSNALATGLLTGLAQTSGSNTYSTYASGTLTVVGVSPTGSYTFAVACATATTTGSFSLTTSGGGMRASGVNILDTQLANESPVASYPATGTGGPPTYTCTNGVISHNY